MRQSRKRRFLFGLLIFSFFFASLFILKYKFLHFSKIERPGPCFLINRLNYVGIKILIFDVIPDYSILYVFENQSYELLGNIRNFCNEFHCAYETFYETDYRKYSTERTKNIGARILAHMTVTSKTDSIHFAVIFPRSDYLWIAIFGKSSKFPLALPKTDFIDYSIKCSIDTIARVYVPRDQEKFSWLLDRSSFMECHYEDVAWPYYERHERTIVPLKPYVQGLTAMMKVSRQMMKTVVISYGTLLGWYRQCDFIVESQDFDFNINSTDFSLEFFQTLWSHRHLKPVMRLQNEQNITEYRIFVPQRKVFDLFLMYFRKDEYSTFVVHAKNFQLWRQDFPFYDRTCSADHLGVLVYLPCDPLKIIQAEYENDRWMSPEETKQSNLHFIRKFEDKKYFNRTMVHFFKKPCPLPKDVHFGCDSNG